MFCLSLTRLTNDERGEPNDKPADWPTTHREMLDHKSNPNFGRFPVGGGARGERVSPRVSRGDPSGRDLAESFLNSRGRDLAIAVP